MQEQRGLLPAVFFMRTIPKKLGLDERNRYWYSYS